MLLKTKRKVFKAYKILFIILIFSNFVKGQDEKYEEFIIRDRIYKPGCGWFKIATGSGYNWQLDTYESSSNICYSFRVKDSYLQMGYHVSSNRFFTYRSVQKLNDLYIAYGWRKESVKSNISVFAGPSYAYGGYYYNTDSLGIKWIKGFSEIGLFASAEYTFKIFYDLGLGFSLCGSYNKYYKVIALQVHFYFSGAFKGEIN